MDIRTRMHASIEPSGEGIAERVGTADPHVNALHISSSAEERQSLRQIFRTTNWNLCQASCLEEVLSLLRDGHEFSVVVCDRGVPSADWQTLHELVSRRPRRPYFIVAAPLGADDVWAEALNLGADDVVATPFDGREISWLVSEAHRNWLQSYGVRRHRVAGAA